MPRRGRGAEGGDIPQCSLPITHNSSTSRSPSTLSRSNVPSNFHFLFAIFSNCQFSSSLHSSYCNSTNLSQYLTHSEQANRDLETHSYCFSFYKRSQSVDLSEGGEVSLWCQDRSVSETLQCSRGWNKDTICNFVLAGNQRPSKYLKVPVLLGPYSVNRVKRKKWEFAL